jgi:hypothetical protein
MSMKHKERNDRKFNVEVTGLWRSNGGEGTGIKGG